MKTTIAREYSACDSASARGESAPRPRVRAVKKLGSVESARAAASIAGVDDMPAKTPRSPAACTVRSRVWPAITATSTSSRSGRAPVARSRGYIQPCGSIAAGGALAPAPRVAASSACASTSGPVTQYGPAIGRGVAQS